MLEGDNNDSRQWREEYKALASSYGTSALCLCHLHDGRDNEDDEGEGQEGVGGAGECEYEYEIRLERTRATVQAGGAAVAALQEKVEATASTLGHLAQQMVRASPPLLTSGRLAAGPSLTPERVWGCCVGMDRAALAAGA